MDRQIDRKIAIIGLGPRGLGALEALSQAAKSRGRYLQIDIFDADVEPGAGPNFDPREPTHCLLNIPLRDIHLRAPADLDVLSFRDWMPQTIGDDAFPPRADLGRYLHQRFAKLAHTPSHLRIKRVPETVERLLRAEDSWQVSGGSNSHGPYDEVLIVPGQPPLRPDDQLAEWQDHAACTDAELAEAYPARRLQTAAET